MDHKDVERILGEAAGAGRYDESLQIQARQHICDALVNGFAEDVATLERTFLSTLALSVPGTVSWSPGMDTDALRASPGPNAVERALAARAAFREAIAGMLISGTLVHVDSLASSTKFNSGTRLSNTSGHLNVAVEDVASLKPTTRVRLRFPAAHGSSTGTVLDPDIYLDGLGPLSPSAEAERCIREAFGAWRAALYLAAASLTALLGEVCLFDEAARMSALPGLAQVDLTTTPSFSVQRAVFDELRTVRRLKNQADAAQAHAELLRRIRNYGLHPRSNVPDPRSTYLADVPTALLLLGTHSYLLVLHDLVDERLSTP